MLLIASDSEWYPWCATRLYHVIYKSMVSYYGQAKECDICETTGHIAKDCPFRGKCLICGQTGHFYRDCRNEPVAATTSGPRELPVDPEYNRTGEAVESDSLVNRTVTPAEFVPAGIVSSDGFTPIRRRAKRKRARIFESSDNGNVDNCLVNDNNGETASSENDETVDIIIDDVNSDSNNIVSNSSVAKHSNACMNDNSTNSNISCDISHTSNVNSSMDDNNLSSNSNSSDALNNCSDNNNNDTHICDVKTVRAVVFIPLIFLFYILTYCNMNVLYRIFNIILKSVFDLLSRIHL